MGRRRVGLTTIVERLNAKGIPGTAGKRWSKTPVRRILKNERYLGRQIWGQQSVEHEPGTGRKIMRDNPRSEWRVEERPELRIISDELWNRVQQTRSEVRKSVAPKQNLGRGKDARFHSKNLFTGFAKCHMCGGAMTTVSGGSGSPRLGCNRSWNQGRDACPNRLTIRMKVAEPQILAKLQTELQQPLALAHITKSLEKEIQKALAAPKAGANDNQRQLEQERKKLQNLIAAIEGGASVPSTLLKAVADREATIKRLEAELRKEEEKPSGKKLPDLPSWVREELKDLAGLLKSDPAKVKSEFRRLNLQLTFHPTEAEPRDHYIVRLGRTGLFLFALTPPECGSGLIEGASGPQPHPSFCWLSVWSCLRVTWGRGGGGGWEPASRRLPLDRRSGEVKPPVQCRTAADVVV